MEAYKNMEAYLDNSATTRCSKRAADLMVKLLTEDYGNPSSLHLKGVEAENYIKEAKQKIAKTLKVEEKELILRRYPRYKDDKIMLWDSIRKSGYTRSYTSMLRVIKKYVKPEIEKRKQRKLFFK